MCPSPHNIGPNPPNMVKHSALSIVPTEYIEKIHQLLLLIFLRPRSVTGNLGSECKYRVLGPDYSINPPEYKSFKAFCEPFDLSLSYVKTSCQLPLQHLVPLRYPRMSAKSPFWPTVRTTCNVNFASAGGTHNTNVQIISLANLNQL